MQNFTPCTSSLSQSYTLGDGYNFSANNSPLTTCTRFASNRVNPFNRMQERLNSPMRFCTQAKDLFVIRIVKVIDKSSALKSDSAANTPRSIRLSAQEIAAFQSLLQRAASQESNIFIRFQAQLPALMGSHVPRSTSADQVSDQNYQVCRLRKAGKGVRLCFSCPLRGNGLKIEDFSSGLVSQRLESWETSSGRPGLLNDVLIAMQKSVELLLTYIKQDGLLTVLPETDYIFYPHIPGQLQPIKWPSRTPSCSSDKFEYKVHSVDTGLDPGYTVPICSLSHSPSNGHSSPILIPSSQKNLMNNSCTLPSVNRRYFLNKLSNGRPVSAYGTIFGNAGTRTPFMPQQHVSVSSFTPARNGIDTQSLDPRICFGCTSSLHPSSGGSPGNYSNLVLCDAPQGNIGQSYVVSSPNEHNDYSGCGRDRDFLHAEMPQSLSSTPPKIQSLVLSIPEREDPLTSLINEVVKRLRKSPQLPLIIMPTQNTTNADASLDVPTVFQLSSPNVVFVGLPANGCERPRIVTSPADCAFVVTSRRPANPDSLATAAGSSTSKYTLATPRPGFMLAVASDGSVCEFKETVKP